MEPAGTGGEQSNGGSSSPTGMVPVAVVVHFPLCRVLLGRASVVTTQVTHWLWHRAARAPPDSCAPVCALIMDGILLDVFDLLSLFFWQMSAKSGGACVFIVTRLG